MPDILVEVRGAWLDGKQMALLEAVRRSVAQALAIPSDELLVRLIEHPSANYVVPDSASGQFVRVEIVLFRGRSLEAKRELYQSIVQNLLGFGIPSEDVKIVLLEVSSENVGFKGGRAACDVDLGYIVNV
jgi:hypothetical protein